MIYFSTSNVIGIVVLCYGGAILPTFYYYVIGKDNRKKQGAGAENK